MLVTDQMKDSSKFSRSSLYGEGISLILKRLLPPCGHSLNTMFSG
jgi:hypothetical protein